MLAREIAVKLIVALPEQLSERVSEGLTRMIAAHGDRAALIAEFQGDGPGVAVVSYQVGEATASAASAVGKAFDVSLWISDLKQLDTVYVNDFAGLDADTVTTSDVVHARDLGTVLFVPVTCRGYVKGILAIGGEQEKTWSEQERSDYRQLGEVLGNVLDREHTDRRLDAVQRELREFRRKFVELQEEERRFLARELHDEIGQYLTVIKTEATLIANRGKSIEHVQSHTEAIHDQANHIYDAIHGLIERLRPSVLDEIGLEGAVRNCVVNSAAAKIGVDCRLEIEGDTEDLDDAVKISVYRVLQECMTNIARHSEASRADVLLRRYSREIADRRMRYRHQGESTAVPTLRQQLLELKVRDNGRGIARGREKAGKGLQGMSERMRAVGGELDIHSRLGGGTEVSATISLSVVPIATELGSM